jgi:predicted Rossmann-fold nucleotide-binding protein
MTWNQLGIINKPCGLLNIEGYFNHLLEYISCAVNERFVRPEHQANLIVDNDPEELIDRLEKYRPRVAEKWIERLKVDLI